MEVQEAGPIGEPISAEVALRWDHAHLPQNLYYHGPRSSSGVPSGTKGNPGTMTLLNGRNTYYPNPYANDDYSEHRLNEYRGYAALRPRKELHRVDHFGFYVMSWRGEWRDGRPYDGDGYLPVELIPSKFQKILPVGCKWIVGILQAGELKKIDALYGKRPPAPCPCRSALPLH